jgi:hypothetical protein
VDAEECNINGGFRLGGPWANAVHKNTLYTVDELEDNDLCLRSREMFAETDTCAGMAHFCSGEHGDDLNECCPCTCDPARCGIEVLPEPADYTYVGCWRDDAERDLNYGPKQYGFDPETCRNVCADYPFFGLQNNGWCSCDYTYGTPASQFPQIDDGNCGNGMGGGWANAIYTNDLFTGWIGLYTPDQTSYYTIHDINQQRLVLD